MKQWNIGGERKRPHSVEDAIKRFNIDLGYYLEVENYLIKQLGFTLVKHDKDKGSLEYLYYYTNVEFVDSFIESKY